MDSLKCKFFAGWLVAENMNEAWLRMWRRVAQKDFEEGHELVVFRIPRGNLNERDMAIKDIEEALQSRFK